MIPQIIYIVLWFLGLGMVIKGHGTMMEYPSKGSNFVTTCLVLGLFFWGGFFSSFGIPQILILGFYCLTLGMAVVRTEAYYKANVWKSLAISIPLVLLLFWGGFFKPLIG